jgi:DNA invertase Pin-like site-specific DNA recombinase
MRVAIYARTSRQEGDDEGSIPVQLADCREWASDAGHEVVDEYVDPGISGWKRKTRPGYEALFADAEAGRIHAVLCRDYERLLRNDKEGARWLDLYETRGFRHFLFADEADINLGRARDRKDFKERVAGAVYYSDRLSEKIRRTKAQHAIDGTYSGGEREPYGYRRARSGALEVDPEEAAALHDAVARLAHGESATRVSREWNAAGARTSRGARWRPRTLRRTLLSEHLSGARGYPRILSDQEVAIVRNTLRSEERRPGRPPGRRSPLVGFLRCADCGQNLTTGGGAYRCSPSRGGCGGVSIKAYPLERFMLVESLRRWLEVGDRAKREDVPDVDAAPALDELRKLERRSEEIAAGLADGTLTVQVGGEASRRVEARRRELAETLARALPPPRTAPVVRKLTDLLTPEELDDVGVRVTARTWNEASDAAFRELWEARDIESVEQLRQLYAEVLDYAVISRRERRGHAFDPARLEIAWR